MRVEARELDGVWRIVEDNGEVCVAWLPWEATPLSLPVDAGGFEYERDCRCFALGVCWCRAAYGLLGDTTPEDIDRERADLEELPAKRTGRLRKTQTFEQSVVEVAEDLGIPSAIIAEFVAHRGCQRYSQGWPSSTLCERM